MNGEPVSSVHTDVGAYALGLLEAADRQAFEEHLAGCPACAAELDELSGMKDLLTGIDPVDAPPGEPTGAEVTDLVRRRAGGPATAHPPPGPARRGGRGGAAGSAASAVGLATTRPPRAPTRSHWSSFRPSERDGRWHQPADRGCPASLAW